MIKILEESQQDSTPQTISPSDISQPEKTSWFDLIPEGLAIIGMLVFIGEVIHLIIQRRLWF